MIPSSQQKVDDIDADQAPAQRENHDGPLFLLAHSLGVRGPVLVSAKSRIGYVSLDLQEALRRIDQFDANGRYQLLTGLRDRFGICGISGAVDEPLYDVINEKGSLLLLGVSDSEARRAIDERLAAPRTWPEWQGELRIVSERRGADVLKANINIYPNRERPEVVCSLRHALLCNMTMAQVMVKLKPALAGAVQRAIALKSDYPPAPHTFAVAISCGDVDPEVFLTIYDPMVCARDMDGVMARMCRVVENYVAAESISERFVARTDMEEKGDAA